MSDSSFSSMTINSLRIILKHNSLSAEGSRNNLISRLQHNKIKYSSDLIAKIEENTNKKSDLNSEDSTEFVSNYNSSSSNTIEQMPSDNKEQMPSDNKEQMPSDNKELDYVSVLYKYHNMPGKSKLIHIIINNNKITGIHTTLKSLGILYDKDTLSKLRKGDTIKGDKLLSVPPNIKF